MYREKKLLRQLIFAVWRKSQIIRIFIVAISSSIKVGHISRSKGLLSDLRILLYVSEEKYS